MNVLHLTYPYESLRYNMIKINNVINLIKFTSFYAIVRSLRSVRDRSLNKYI